MKRRSFLKKAGAGLAVGATAGLAACGKEDATPRGSPAVQAGLPGVRWRLTSSFPKNLDVMYASAEILANRVRLITDGKFDIRIYPPGEIAPSLQALEAVQQGTVEACHSCSYYYVDKDRAFAFGSALPFGLNARQMNAWVMYGGGQQLLDEFYSNYNAVSFMAGNSGAQMGGWFRKRIKTLADLRGLKIRTSGLAGELLARLGADPQQIAGSDIFPSLEKGIIDAAEWAGPHDDEKLGFYKIAPYYYYPGWLEPNAATHFFVNRTEWLKLPVPYQEAFRSAAHDANVGMLASYDDKNPQALSRLLSYGVKLESYPEEIMKAAYKAAFELYHEEAEKNPAWARIFSGWEKYRKAQNEWFRVAEAHVDRFCSTCF